MGPLVCLALSMGKPDRSTDLCFHPVRGEFPGEIERLSKVYKWSLGVRKAGWGFLSC